MSLGIAHGQIPVLEGRLVAAAIPGVSAIAPVGTFLPGGPIPTKFAAYAQPGKVLDPKHILVGSTSNFGEALADPRQLPGSFLSIDPTGSAVLAIPMKGRGAGAAGVLKETGISRGTEEPARCSKLVQILISVGHG